MKLKRFENFEQEEIGSGDFASFTNGKFWGSVAGGTIPIAKSTGRILVPFRSEHVNEPHTWGVWGGKMDNDEQESDIKNVVKREFLEESGYDNDMELFDAYIFESDNFKYYNFIGLIDEEFEPELDWETESFEWMTLEELEKIEPKHFGLRGLLENSIDIINEVFKKI
jgi:8-oxo-dGTP pyrophosphatase MutT (NUDIX family)